MREHFHHHSGTHATRRQQLKARYSKLSQHRRRHIVGEAALDPSPNIAWKYSIPYGPNTPIDTLCAYISQCDVGWEAWRPALAEVGTELGPCRAHDQSQGNRVADERCKSDLCDEKEQRNSCACAEEHPRLLDIAPENQRLNCRATTSMSGPCVVSDTASDTRAIGSASYELDSEGCRSC